MARESHFLHLKIATMTSPTLIAARVGGTYLHSPSVLHCCILCHSLIHCLHVDATYMIQCLPTIRAIDPSQWPELVSFYTAAHVDTACPDLRSPHASGSNEPTRLACARCIRTARCVHMYAAPSEPASTPLTSGITLGKSALAHRGDGRVLPCKAPVCPGLVSARSHSHSGHC